jgi:hypothetical protein
MRWPLGRIPPGANRLGAAFMLGVACALWLFPVIAGPGMQRLRLERDRAGARAESLQAEVNRLTEAERKRQKVPVVRRTRVDLRAPDERVKLEASRRIQKALAAEVGRPVDDISPLLLYTDLQGTDLRIDGVRYRLDIRFMSVGAELAVSGQISPIKN